MIGGDHGKRDLWGGTGAGGECDADGAGRRSGELAIAGDSDGQRCGGTVRPGRSGGAGSHYHSGGGTQPADRKLGAETKDRVYAASFGNRVATSDTGHGFGGDFVQCGAGSDL